MEFVVDKKGKSHFDKILQIGINYYGTPSKLNGCINDVLNINRYLRETLDCEGTQCRLMRDDRDKGGANYPTAQNIVGAIQWLTQDATPYSRLFFHYSGHGSSVPDRNRDEEDGRDEVICPVAGPAITDDYLRCLLVDKLPAGAELVAVFDCCHSGTILDLKHTYKVKMQQQQKEYSILSNNLCRPTRAKVVLFSGCLDSQYSADTWEERQAQGAMTYAFLKTLRDLRKLNKPLSYKNVIKSMVNLLKSRGYKQIPQMSSGTFLNLEEELW